MLTIYRVKKNIIYLYYISKYFTEYKSYMSQVQPIIDDTIFALVPTFHAVSITVTSDGIQSIPDSNIHHILTKACEDALNADFPWANDHIEAWNAIYRSFGAKPNRTASSAAALRKRVFKNGPLEPINPIVDIYNAVSIRYALSVGGEDLDCYVGNPHLTRAQGNEKFDTMKNGDEVIESPEVGEVIWRDDVGVTCRRWNWRQCVRTRITDYTKNFWFILESQEAMPLTMLHQASNDLIEFLKLVLINPSFTTTLLQHNS